MKAFWMVDATKIERFNSFDEAVEKLEALKKKGGVIRLAINKVKTISVAIDDICVVLKEDCD